jgi:hypothetical protein
LQQVRSLIAKGDKAGAGRALSLIDEHFGGLGAPDSVALEREITTK